MSKPQHYNELSKLLSVLLPKPHPTHPMMAMVNKIVVIKSDLEPQPLQTSLPPAIAITNCVSEWIGLFWA